MVGSGAGGHRCAGIRPPRADGRPEAGGRTRRFLVYALRGFARRVGVAVAGASGQGCLGYWARISLAMSA